MGDPTRRSHDPTCGSLTARALAPAAIGLLAVAVLGPALGLHRGRSGGLGDRRLEPSSSPATSATPSATPRPTSASPTPTRSATPKPTAGAYIDQAEYQSKKAT